MPDADEFGPFKADAAKLHLRSTDGNLFGPVPLSTLRQWAAEGRVSAGDEVSHDQTLWVRVETLPDLKLEWNGETPDGSPFGPFNLLAVPHLVERGFIGLHSYLRNRTTGKQLAVDALLRLEDRDTQDGALLSTPPPVPDESAEADMSAGPHPPPVGLHVANERLRQELQENFTAAEDQRRELGAKLEAAQEEIAALQTQCRLQSEASQLREREIIRRNTDEMDRLRRELEQERALRTETTQQGEEQAKALRQEIQELQHRVATADAETAKLQDELLARKLEIYSGEEARSEREQQLVKQVDDARKQREELEKSLAKSRQTRETELRDAAQRQQRLEQAVVALEARQQELAFARAAAQELERKASDALARIEAAESKTRAAAARLEELQSLADEAQRLKARLAELETHKDVEQTAQRGREATQQDVLRARIRELEEESASSTALLEQLRRELDEQRRKNKELKAAATAAETGAADVSELKRALADERAAGKAARDKAAAAEKEMKATTAAAEEGAAEIAKLKRALADERAAGEAARTTAAAAAAEGRRKLSEAESQCEQVRAELAAQQAATNKLREASEQRERDLAAKAAAVPSSADEARWYLKIDEASVFGPIVLADLRNWTTEGRIGPQHLVSCDRQQWSPASNLAELGMDWMVSLPDGTAFGPLSLGAIRTLVKDGTVPADAKVAHRSTQEAWTAERLMNTSAGL